MQLSLYPALRVDIDLDFPPDELDEITWIVLDQTNTSGFDLPSGGGTFAFGNSPIIRYGTEGRIPAPPEHESAAEYATEYLYSDLWGLDETPTLGEMNDIREPSYGGSRVCINEVRPGDSVSGDEPFVELFNSGESPVDIGGWSIVADERYRIPAGTMIDAGGFVVCNAVCFGGAFRLSAITCTLCIQSGEGVMFERTGWSGINHAGNSLVRFPDGFSTLFNTYDNASALDFRESNPTPGAPNEALYPISFIEIENDSLVVRPGTTHQYHCDGIDTNGSRFRITPQWRTEGDVASIDSAGLLTGINSGNGLVIAEFGGLSAFTPVFGTLTSTVQNDLVLDAESSPFWIDVLNIKDGVTLTIEPGVTLFFKWGGGPVSHGAIRAIGTEDNPIRFLPIPGADSMFDSEGQYMGAWNGISLHGGGNVFRECIIEQATTGISLDFPTSGNQLERTMISNCEFPANAVALGIHNAAQVSQCLITGAGVGRQGISISGESNDVSIMNNTIYDVSWNGILIENGQPSVINNCIDKCRYGIYFSGDHNADVRYNAVRALDTPFFQATGGLGDLNTMNRNGTSCDVFGNISVDPSFIDPAAGDYRLAAGSPCIDAGDPSLVDDDGSISDIGCISGSDNSVKVESVERPLVVMLHPNHPNPFNPSTSISFSLPEQCRVRLEIFNIAGQRVAVLADEIINAGEHSVSWRVSADQAAGVYFCRLNAGGRVRTMKMLYMK